MSDILAPAPNLAASDASRPRFEFTGSGSEYFRIWIVNVLLTIVTLGIYSAWAKVRRLRYFYNNTRFAGSNFDFHGSPVAILKGRLIAVLLIALINVPLLGLVVLLVYFCALPWLLYRSMRFHLGNTTWRNVRFAFVGDAAGIYKALLVPLGVVIAAGLASALAMWLSPWIGMPMMILTMLAFYALGPYLQYRLRRYYTDGARAGESPFALHVSVGQYYVVYFVAFAYMIVLGAIASVVVGVTLGMDVRALSNPGDFPVGKLVAIAILVAGFYIAMLAIGPLLMAMLQNTVWKGTSLEGQRFHSDLAVGNFMITWLGLTLATILTLGLYRPFAAVTLARLRINAMSWTGSADDLVAVMRQGTAGATGAEVADLMDVDISL